jgi:hypothetical protein
MSKHNKANKDHYVQRGRLSQDDMARERINQAQVSSGSKGKENVTGKARSKRDVPGPTPRRSAREE